MATTDDSSKTYDDTARLLRRQFALDTIHQRRTDGYASVQLADLWVDDDLRDELTSLGFVLEPYESKVVPAITSLALDSPQHKSVVDTQHVIPGGYTVSWNKNPVMMPAGFIPSLEHTRFPWGSGDVGTVESKHIEPERSIRNLSFDIIERDQSSTLRENLEKIRPLGEEVIEFGALRKNNDRIYGFLISDKPGLGSPLPRLSPKLAEIFRVEPVHDQIPNEKPLGDNNDDDSDNEDDAAQSQT